MLKLHDKFDMRLEHKKSDDVMTVKLKRLKKVFSSSNRYFFINPNPLSSTDRAHAPRYATTLPGGVGSVR